LDFAAILPLAGPLAAAKVSEAGTFGYDASMTSRRLLPALTLAALLFPAYAEAQGPPTGAPGTATPAAKAEAGRLSIEGKKALKEKRYDDAVKALQQAVDLDPNPQARLDLAEALIADSKLLEASRVLHAVADALPNPSTTKLQEAAKKSLSEIEPRIPWLQIDVIGPEEGTASVKVDGKEVDATSEVPLNPGEHKITVSAEGFATAKRNVELEEGVHDTKKIKLKKKVTKSEDGEDAEGVKPEGKPEGKPEDKPEGSRSGGDGASSIFSPSHPKFPAVAIAGAGVAFLIVGAATGGAALSQTNSIRKNDCLLVKANTYTCPPSAQDDINAAKRMGNASTATLIIGGIGVATGAVLFFVLPDANKHAAIKPTKDAAEPTQDAADPDAPAAPKKRKKRKKPVEPTEDAEPTEAFIAPYVGFGQAGVFGRF
jgi:hypothetical protein